MFDKRVCVSHARSTGTLRLTRYHVQIHVFLLALLLDSCFFSLICHCYGAAPLLIGILNADTVA